VENDFILNQNSRIIDSQKNKTDANYEQKEKQIGKETRYQHATDQTGNLKKTH